MALSKTAKASMVKEVKQTAVEAPEESLKQLRLDLGAGLYIPAHRIRVLLNAYDALNKETRKVEQALDLGRFFEPIPTFRRIMEEEEENSVNQK